MRWRFDSIGSLRLFMAHLRDRAREKGLPALADEFDELATAPFLQGEFLMVAGTKLEGAREAVRTKLGRADHRALVDAITAILRAQFPD